MATIDRFLGWLEQRIQGLVEGGASWLLPGGRRRRELAGWLGEVMAANTRRGSDRSLQAPDTFILTLPRAAAANMDDGLLAELAAALQNAARQRGLVLLSQPVVRVVADPFDGAARVQVAFSDTEVSDTTTVEVEAPHLAPVESPLGRAYLVVEGGSTFLLSSPVVSIGRDPGNLLVLGDLRVSRTHAQLRLVQGQYVIFDLQSTGGTMVNGRLVVQQALAPGDVISLAGVLLVYGQDMLGESEATQHMPADPENLEALLPSRCCSCREYSWRCCCMLSWAGRCIPCGAICGSRPGCRQSARCVR